MRRFILIFLCVSVVYAKCGLEASLPGKTAGLRVKYGKGSEESIDKDIFFDIPRTERDAEAKGWKETVPPPSPLPHLKLYCPEGRELCTLYHPVSKFVAGIQLALPVDGVRADPKTMQKYFTRWSAQASSDEPAKDYWVASQFFVPKESDEYVPTKANGETLQYNGVWVKGPEGNLIEVPVNETILQNDFTKQSCIPKMGTHYYFHLSQELRCDGVFPWFPLVKGGKLIGLGFNIYGQRTTRQNQYREWYETLGAPADIITRLHEIVVPDAPLCFSDLYADYKYMALHIYYIDEPWKVTCSPEDSKIPLPEDALKFI